MAKSKPDELDVEQLLNIAERTKRVALRLPASSEKEAVLGGLLAIIDQCDAAILIRSPKLH